MRDMRERIAEAFEYSAIWYLENADHAGEDLTDEEGRNVASFHILEESVVQIPPALIQDVTELASKYPDVFELWLTTLLGSVCDQYRPATAAEFVEQLNAFIRRETVALAPG
jgi:hypothetical protein